MDCSSLWLFCFLVATASTQSIRLPDMPADQSDCTTSSGVPGECVDVRFCPNTARSLDHDTQAACGFNDTFPIVCCTTVADNSVDRVQDISPPTVDFECGNNVGRVIRLQEISPGPEKFLRADNVIVFPEGTEESSRRPVTRAGFLAGEIVTHIIGGAIVKKHSWPWMALIGERDAAEIRWFCGGVLINQQWVLTAQHCFFQHTADIVRLGEHDYNDDNDGAVHQDIKVADAVPFPDFAHPKAYHDLELLKLVTAVTIQKFISPVCLPWGSESSIELLGQQATLAGWGDTLFGGYPSSILQEVNVTVFSSDQCDRSYSILSHYAQTWPQGIGEETMCAGDPEGGRDACQGDSGGPIMSQDALGRFMLAGIVSQGYGCGNKEYPGLYVNVRNPLYLAWIKKIAFS
ncbi:clotting factor G beta subunit-like isoform X2 [Portunus trituberculatus]|uniref:clotting factor G beta subunit-like isoform X2 n=1 Tax=Portunus trituberculatus TaxID=210409 RepID=UPI001E1CC8D6|nr:clotting factor G beta subunit-like isoform X2 [Portunus trituberculatus]